VCWPYDIWQYLVGVVKMMRSSGDDIKKRIKQREDMFLRQLMEMQS
jgi:hypothetical protein